MVTLMVDIQIQKREEETSNSPVSLMFKMFLAQGINEDANRIVICSTLYCGTWYKEVQVSYNWICECEREERRKVLVCSNFATPDRWERAPVRCSNVHQMQLCYSFVSLSLSLSLFSPSSDYFTVLELEIDWLLVSLGCLWLIQTSKSKVFWLARQREGREREWEWCRCFNHTHTHTHTSLLFQE